MPSKEDIVDMARSKLPLPSECEMPNIDIPVYIGIGLEFLYSTGYVILTFTKEYVGPICIGWKLTHYNNEPVL